MIEVRNLSIIVRGKTLLENISLDIERGRIYALLGENGSGKTTLIRSLCSYFRDYEGNIIFDGKELRECDRKTRERFHSLMPQNLPVIDLTVSSLLSLYPEGVMILKEFGLERLLDSRMNMLSGGERQMVFLSFALSHDALLYAFDEPEASLDVKFRGKTENAMRELRDSGKSVIVSLHDITRAINIADEIIILQKGHLSFAGSKEAVLDGNVIEKLFGMRREEVGNQIFFI